MTFRPLASLAARAVRALALPLLALTLFALPAAAAGTRVSGRVIDADTQQPVAGADVELQNSGGGPGYHRTRTDAKGEFTLTDVRANRWYVFTVGANGYTDWSIDGWQFPQAQDEVRLTVPLDRAGSLAVTVTAADGKTPVPAARVTIRSERAPVWYEQYGRNPEPRWTDKAGRVSFPGLGAGTWALSVEATGLRAGDTRRVPVRRGETTPVTLVMTKPGGFSGAVRLADSTGVAGVSVIARGPGEATATTDARGEWALGDLGPGRWRIEVSHEGLEQVAARDALQLREGEQRAIAPFVVTPRAPALSLVLQREAFAPGEKQQVGVRAFRFARVDFTLWKLTTAQLLDAKKDYRAAYVSGADTTGLARVQAWTHELPDGPPFAWREQDVTLPDELPAGAYVLEAKAGRLAKRVVFFVTDLSLVVKRSAGGTLLWAGSLKTGLPLADVIVIPAGAAPADFPGEGQGWGAALARARAQRSVTDADGLVKLAGARDVSRLRVVAVSEAHGVAVAESPLSGEAAQGGDKLFLYTERPLYRPGQTIFWKLFARNAQGEGYTVPAAGGAVGLTLNGPDGATIEAGSATLSETGAADGRIDVPADTPLGEWTLSASAGRANGSATLAIQQYRKPEYKVDVTPERDVYVNGDEVRFAVAAGYFFGAPVVGATVRYTLFESRLANDDAWEEGGEEGGFGRLLESGESRTDVDGRVRLSFMPQRVAYDRRLSLEVEVVDGSQRTVSSRGSALVGRGLFTVKLEPQAGLFMAGKPVVVDVVTQDLKGQPVSAPVTVDLDQDVWDPLERRYTRSSRPIASTTSVTSAVTGRARVTISPGVARSGYLTVRARAADERGNKLATETSFWVFDEKAWSYAYRYPSLEAIPDRAHWAPGDTARILVNTDVKDASVLVSVEGRELHEQRVQHLFGNSGLVKVAIKPEYAPNVFVALHVRRGREVHSRVLELKVDAVRHDLAITLTPDRPTAYRPQDPATFTVETKDAQGRPVPAEVSVGVVDESIYALRADDTPNPHDVFYGRRPNWVTTVVSFPTLYYGGADKSDHGEVRRDFRDVAVWAPAVRTGADGKASVTLKYPDNLTTWRATARGLTASTLVGTAVTKTLVSKEVVARLAVPRTFTAGDEAELVSVVNNRTQQPQVGVSEALEVKGAAKLTSPASLTSSMAAGGESRSRWNVSVAAESPKDGSDAAATFTFRAKAKADADALEQVVPVRPRAVALHPGGAGAVGGASQAVSVNLPADLVKSGSRLRLELLPSPAAVTLASVNWLGDYPYGCTEQTANAILPATALLAAARTAGVSVPGWEDPEKKLGPYLDHLVALRTDDGGWGWWKSNDADGYFTSLAVDALAHAAAADVRRDQCLSWIEQAFWNMPRFVGEVRSLDGEAYCALHLSSAVTLPEAANRFGNARALVEALARSCHDQRDQLGTAGLACAATACARLGLAAEARALLDALLQRGKADGGGFAFPADDPDAWFGDGVENTAYALSALTAVAPADARALELVRSLTARRTGRGWKSTRVTGAAAVALAEWLLAHPGEMQGAARAKAVWNGETVFDGPLGAAGAFAPGAAVTLPGARLKPGANELVIAREGAGALHWAWTADANVPSPGPAVNEPRLLVKREYLHATRTADQRGRTRWLLSPVDAQNPLRVGEAVLVRLTLTAAKPLRWILVEDPKPAGFEIDAVLPDGVDRPYGTWGEARDDRAAFFVGWLDQGENVIEYLLRPEMAGAFTALPPSAGGMYDPALVTRGAEARLRVASRP